MLFLIIPYIHLSFCAEVKRAKATNEELVVRRVLEKHVEKHRPKNVGEFLKAELAKCGIRYI